MKSSLKMAMLLQMAFVAATMPRDRLVVCIKQRAIRHQRVIF
jgi:hypothetical protein